MGRFVAVTLLCCVSMMYAQDIGSLVNFRLKHDGSEVLLEEKLVPEAVRDVFEQSEGVALLVKEGKCKKGGECDIVVQSQTAFAIADHVVITNFHLVEGDVKVSSRNGAITSALRNKPNFPLKIKLIFGGAMYGGEVLNRRKIGDRDLLAIEVLDKDNTFNAPPVKLSPVDMTPGTGHFYVQGFYGGCPRKEEDEWEGPGSYFCVTPGILEYHLFKGYSRDNDWGNNLGVMMGFIAPGFSGSPVLNEKGECVGVGKGSFYEHLWMYFVPVDELRQFLHQVQLPFSAYLPPFQ